MFRHFFDFTTDGGALQDEEGAALAGGAKARGKVERYDVGYTVSAKTSASPTPRRPRSGEGPGMMHPLPPLPCVVPSPNHRHASLGFDLGHGGLVSLPPLVEDRTFLPQPRYARTREGARAVLRLRGGRGDAPATLAAADGAEVSYPGGIVGVEVILRIPGVPEAGVAAGDAGAVQGDVAVVAGALRRVGGCGAAQPAQQPQAVRECGSSRAEVACHRMVPVPVGSSARSDPAADCPSLYAIAQDIHHHAKRHLQGRFPYVWTNEGGGADRRQE